MNRKMKIIQLFHCYQEKLLYIFFISVE